MDGCALQVVKVTTQSSQSLPPPLLALSPPDLSPLRPFKVWPFQGGQSPFFHGDWLPQERLENFTAHSADIN